MTTQGPGRKMELPVSVSSEVQPKKQDRRKRQVGRSEAAWLGEPKIPRGVNDVRFGASRLTSLGLGGLEWW